MSTRFSIKRNDTAPSILEDLYNGDNTPLLGIDSVQFHLSDLDGRVVINKAGEVVVNNTVLYEWASGDTDLPPGDYLREWEVVLLNGEVVTVPNDRPGYVVSVTPELA